VVDRPIHYQSRTGDLLTARQREVLARVAAGKTNAEIGEALGVSFETAKMHVADILTRLGVDSREEAARLWRDERHFGHRLRRMLAVGLLSPLRIVLVAGAVVVAGGALLAAVALTRPAERGASDAEIPGSTTEPPLTAAPAQPTETEGATEPASNAIGVRWDLVTIDGEPIPRAERAPYLLLGPDGYGAGYGGCNGYGSPYVLTGDRLEFGSINREARACGEQLNTFEQEFVDGLAWKLSTIELAGDYLTVRTDAGQALDFAARLDADPDNQLIARRWRLEHVSGRGEARYAQWIFTFSADGSFSGMTGCGELRGTYVRSGLEISLTIDGEPPATCPEPERTHDLELRATLSAATTYLVDYWSVLFVADDGSVGLWDVTSSP